MPTAAELLQNPEALLTTSHLYELGLSRRAAAAVFRHLDRIHLPGYERPMVRVRDYLTLLEENTYAESVIRPPSTDPQK